MLVLGSWLLGSMDSEELYGFVVRESVESEETPPAHFHNYSS
jgi:hypothetical protein